MDYETAKKLFPHPHMDYVEKHLLAGLNQGVREVCLAHQMVQVLFKNPELAKYMEKLAEQKVKDESEKRKLDRRREKEILGTLP